MLKLNDPSLLRDRAYIGGVWTAAADRKAVHNPANGALIAEVADVGVAGALYDLVLNVDSLTEIGSEAARETGSPSGGVQGPFVDQPRGK